MPFVPPDLDELCSQHFRWRDLIQCGETWLRLASQGTPVANLPQQSETWNGIRGVAMVLLDPLADQFGKIEVTYAFVGAELSRHIKRRIAPGVDQHAGSELRKDGGLICPRRGQAVDLRAPEVPRDVVVRYIRTQINFDRLYTYDGSETIHCSVGPQNSALIYAMSRSTNGRLIPRLVR